MHGPTERHAYVPTPGHHNTSLHSIQFCSFWSHSMKISNIWYLASFHFWCALMRPKLPKSYMVLSPKKEKVQATVSYFVAYCRFKMVADIKVKVSLMLLFLSIFMWFFFMVSVRATKYRLKSKFFWKKAAKNILQT